MGLTIEPGELKPWVSAMMIVHKGLAADGGQQMSFPGNPNLILQVDIGR